MTAGSLVAASPAFALRPDDGDDPGQPLSPLATVLFFVVAPVGLFLLIALLVLAPSIARGPRYRPGLGWQAGPEWYGGPADADAAVERTLDHPVQEFVKEPPPADSAAGARTGTDTRAGTDTRTGTEPAGGTSARW